MKAIRRASKKPCIIKTIIFALCLVSSGTSCVKFVEPDDPTGQIAQSAVFKDEATATAAVMTLYGSLRDNVMLTGGSNGMNILMGFYADELDYYGSPGLSEEAFYNHQIVAAEARVKTIWNGAYNLIYMCNSAIEGLETSQDLSSEVKTQLRGEALFIRAIVHFYLVNLIGDIPYITTSDYLVNMEVSRGNTDMVYENILNDLNEAKSLLTNEYSSGERIRANKYAVSALMSRVYLYMQRWQDAEEESTMVISASHLFALESDLAEEFLKGSSSAILQLKPKNEGENTMEATVFLFTSGPPINMALRQALIESFEPGDLRRQSWTKEIPGVDGPWYAPYKYRHRELSGVTLEYSIVLRLAEQYLIRAEARVHTGDLPGAIEDINIIRNRAGLPDTPATTEAEILQAVSYERRFELFTEQGHRWFDLKRSGNAGDVLIALKPNWKATDILFPVPESELLLNPNLLPQNPGY